MGLVRKIKKKLTRSRLARLPITALQKRLSERRGATGVCFHAISNEFKGYPYVTAPEVFEAQLDFLSETYEIRPVHEVASALMDAAFATTEKPMAFVCFDDAYRDNLYAATPLLEKYSVRATLFAPRDLVRRGGATHMTEAEIQQIAGHSLWTLGAHGITHNVLPAFSPEDIQRELTESQDWLSDLTGQVIDGFAYPQGQVCPVTVEMARQTYAFAVTTDQRLTDSYDPFQIRRYCPTKADDSVHTLAVALLLSPYEIGAE